MTKKKAAEHNFEMCNPKKKVQTLFRVQTGRDLLIIEAAFKTRGEWRKNETLKVEHNLCTYISKSRRLEQ